MPIPLFIPLPIDCLERSWRLLFTLFFRDDDPLGTAKKSVRVATLGDPVACDVPAEGGGGGRGCGGSDNKISRVADVCVCFLAEGHGLPAWGVSIPYDGDGRGTPAGVTSILLP